MSKRSLPDVQCPTCGKLFRPDSRYTKFCSRRCVGIALRPIRKLANEFPLTADMAPVDGLLGYYVKRNGTVWSSRRAAPLTVRSIKPFPGSRGYASFNAYIGDGSKRRRTFLVHLCVLRAFVGPRPDGMEGCHNDGDRMNAELSNLRWDTRSGNFSDKFSHGTAAIGERHPMAKLTDRQAEEIRIRRANGERPGRLAKEFGITASHVWDIANRHVRRREYGPVNG